MMTHPTQTLPFVCTDCGKRSPTLAECACGAGPLVDLSKEDVRNMVVEIEDRRAEAHAARLLWIAVVLGVSTGLFVLAVCPQLVLWIPLPIPFANPIKFVALMIFVAFVSLRVFERLFPPRRFFSEAPQTRAGASLPTNMKSVSSKTFLVIGGVVLVSLGVSAAVPLLSAYGDRKDAEHRLGQRAAYDTLSRCVTTESTCKAELDSLYDTVRERNADMAMRLLLESKLGCAESCNAARLPDEMTSIDNLAIDLGWRTGFAPSAKTKAGEKRGPERFGFARGATRLEEPTPAARSSQE